MGSSDDNAYASYEWGKAGYSDGTAWGELGYSDRQLEKASIERISNPDPGNQSPYGILPYALLAITVFAWYSGVRAFYLHYLMGSYFISYPATDLAIMLGAFAVVQIVLIACLISLCGWLWSVIAIPVLLPPLYPVAIFAASFTAERWLHFSRFRSYIDAEFYAGRFPERLDRWISHQLDDIPLAIMQMSIPEAMSGYALIVPVLLMITLLVHWARGLS